MRLLLSLANASAEGCKLVKSLSLNFSDNRVRFALELLIYKVLRLLPRPRTLNVEVSIHENRHRALAWMFPPGCSLPAALLSRRPLGTSVSTSLSFSIPPVKSEDAE